jgi:hypothetical protein
MRHLTAKLLAPLAAASLAVLGVSGGLAAADGAANGGQIHLYEADTALDGNFGTVVITGAVTDTGTDNQGAGQNGANLLELSKGTFQIDVSAIGNKLSALPVDPTTCSSNGTVTGRVPIVPGSGTGAYQGITGTLETKATAAAIYPHLPGGRCDTGATQYPGILYAEASGRATFK